MAILLIDSDLSKESEEFRLIQSYFDTMVELVPQPSPHYDHYRVQGLDVPKDDQEIDVTLFEMKSGRLAIGNIS